LAYDAAVMGDGSIPADAFARIDVPTTVLAGGASPEWMRSSAAAAAAAIPGARSVVLPGQTHDVAADVLAAAVRGAVTAYADRP
jgi:pimeloyl-ACP methyl ester carboxylesterase